MRPSPRRRLTSLPVLFFAVLLLAALPRTGWAHAVLMESVPADGASLDTAPATLSLEFNEPVTPVRIQLLDGQGRDMADPQGALAEDNRVRLALPPGLPKGLYVASYRVTSADGHPVAGSFTFGIGVTPAPTTGTSPADDPSQAAAFAGLLLRAMHYAALLAGTGGGLFLLLVTGRWAPLNDRLKPALCLMLLVAGLSAVLLVGVTGATLAGQPLAALATGAPWTTGAGSSVGLSAGIALLALLCSACGLAVEARSAMGPVLLVTGALLGAASLAATGHAATASLRWLSAPLVGLHGLMAAFWIGAFWPLSMALRLESPAEAARLTRRFSRIAIGAVAILAGAGMVLSAIQLQSVQSVLSSGYGWVWLGKMLAVLLLLALAAWNRQVLTPALHRIGDRALRSLRRSIGLEMAAAGTALLLTAAFALTPPPRALHASEDKPPAGFSTVAVKGGLIALIDVVPASPGRNGIRLHLQNEDGKPVAAREVTMNWELPSAGVAPLRHGLTNLGPGFFGADDTTLPLAGQWSLRLEVLIDDFDKRVFQTEVPIRETPASTEGIPTSPKLR
ncbi:copper resistance protein CopC [Azospirillum sp. A26]|uniref:copper resistance CopC/CopD family protein n=1 Tax=Azospirillum sp. A26 TaxID=3160607 RepID=UPI00366FBCCA